MADNKNARKRLLMFSLFLAIMTILLFVAGFANPAIVIEDKGLEEAVKDKLNRKHGPIYRTDLTFITHLDASDKNIKSLKGIESFTRLAELNLENNRVEDLSPLAGLNSLKILNLRNNGIIDLRTVNFDALSGIRLRELNLSHNIQRDGEDAKIRLVDIGLIGRLSSLEKLELRDNHIEDLSSLKKLKNLRELDLRQNRLQDIEALSGLKELEVLNLRENAIKSLEALKDLSKLKYLNIHSNESIKSIKPLENLFALEALSMRDVKIHDNSNVFYNFPKLKKLNARNTGLNNTKVLENAKGLEELNLRDNGVEDIEVLRDKVKMQHLNLRGNDIKSIEALSNMKELSYLNIHSNTNIESLAPLKHLTNLESLIMRNVGIVDHIDIFDDMGNLQRLNALNTGVENCTVETFSKLIVNGGLTGDVRPYIVLYTLDEPIFSKEGGFYKDSIKVNLLNNNNDESRIYYTLDGSEPSMDSAKYDPEKPIEIEKKEDFSGQVLRAKVFSDDGQISKTASNTYFINDKIDERFTLPVISLSTNEEYLFDEEEGIYADKNFNEKGKAWERPVHVEFFEEDGQLAFKQDAGIRIHGGASRVHSQKSFRLYADFLYDRNDRFYYDVFDKNIEKPSYKNLILRNSGNDIVSVFFRDALMQKIVEPLGTIDTQAYRPAAIYINGQYWGILNIRERFDEFYFEDKYDLDKDKVTILEINGSIYRGGSGANKDYRAMLDFITENSLKDDKNYKYISELMDIENYIDYFIVETFYGNTDWPHNNIKFWKYDNNNSDNANAEKIQDGKWRWILFDTDFGFNRYKGVDGKGNIRDVDHNTIDWVIDEFDGRTGKRTWPNFLFRALLENSSFKEDFIGRYADLLNSILLPENIIPLIDEMQANLVSEMPYHIERWGAIPSMENWENNVEVLREFARLRPDYIRSHLINELDLEGISQVTLKIHGEEGSVFINSMEISNLDKLDDNIFERKLSYFNNIPIGLEAISKEESVFSHWNYKGEMIYDSKISVSLSQDENIEAVFNKPLKGR